MSESGFSDHASDLRVAGTDVDARAARGEDAVELRGDDEAGGAGGLGDEVDVGGGEGVGELFAGLVVEEEGIGEVFGFDDAADFRHAFAAADEDEAGELIAGVEGRRGGLDGGEHGGDVVAEAEVAGVHDDEVFGEVVVAAEGFCSRGTGASSSGSAQGVMRTSLRWDAFGFDDALHAAAEDDDAVGGAEEFAVDGVEEAGDEGAGLHDAEGDGDVGVEVHFVLDVA